MEQEDVRPEIEDVYQELSSVAVQEHVSVGSSFVMVERIAAMVQMKNADLINVHWKLLVVNLRENAYQGQAGAMVQRIVF